MSHQSHNLNGAFPFHYTHSTIPSVGRLPSLIDICYRTDCYQFRFEPPCDCLMASDHQHQRVMGPPTSQFYIGSQIQFSQQPSTQQLSGERFYPGWPAQSDAREVTQSQKPNSMMPSSQDSFGGQISTLDSTSRDVTQRATTTSTSTTTLQATSQDSPVSTHSMTKKRGSRSNGRKKRSNSSKKSGKPAKDKLPVVKWNDRIANSLTDKLLDKIEEKDRLRRILYPRPGDQSSGKPKTYAYAKLAKYLFEKHKAYGKWFNKSSSHWKEVVRTKLMKLGLKYKQFRRDMYSIGISIFDDQPYEFPQYFKMHELLGERCSIGTLIVCSADPPDLSASRLGSKTIARLKAEMAQQALARRAQKSAKVENKSSEKKAKKSRNDKGNEESSAESSESETGCDGEDDESSASESGEYHNSDSEETEDSEMEKAEARWRNKKQKLGMRTANNQLVRLDSNRSDIREAGHRRTQEKLVRDAEMTEIRKTAHVLAEKRLQLEENLARLQEENMRRMAEIAERDFEWKMKILEIEAMKVRSELEREMAKLAHRQ